MPTLSEIVRRNPHVKMERLRWFEQRGMLPEPVGVSSEGRDYDEAEVLALFPPDEGTVRVADWQSGMRAGFEYLLLQARTAEAKKLRIAAAEYLLTRGNTGERITDAADRLGACREHFSRVVKRVQKVTGL